MNLTHKKINFLGDSITHGSCTTSESKRFSNLLEQQFSLAAARNYGISGTRFARQTAPEFGQDFNRDFCLRFPEMDDDADIVVVFGGTNDFGHGDAPFGTFDDKTPDTFCGAVDFLCRGLLEKFPNSKIVFITPLHRTGEDSTCGDGSLPLPNGRQPLKGYVDAILKIVGRYQLPILDVYYGEAEKRFTPDKFADGLHLNDDGHVVMAKVMTEFLETL